MYGWGTPDTLGHVTSFVGTTVSQSYRDRFFASLTSKQVKTVVSLLARQLCGLMVLDNFQWGQQLREQRGGKSSKLLIGTTEAAHRVFSYLNFEWDAHKIGMTFTKKQVIPSPHHMRTYEMINFSSPSLGTDLFTNHRDIPVGKEPCFEGTHVSSYSNAITLRRYLLALRNALSHDYDNDKHNNGPGLCRFKDYICDPSAVAFFCDVKDFQRMAVRDWNPNCDEITLSFNMGFIGVREDSSDGAASVILDMLLKFGLLVYNDDETWALHKFAKVRRLYCFGDRKTIENNSICQQAEQQILIVRTD